MTLTPRLLQPQSCHLYTAMRPTFKCGKACMILHKCRSQQ